MAVTAPARIAAERLTDSFRAWRIGSGAAECSPVEVVAATLIGAANVAAMNCSHKDHFVVEQTAHTGKRTLHFYAVKRKSQPYYVRDEDGTTRRAQPLYAEHLFSMAVSEFAPVEPWRWTPGCDVVGLDRNEVRDPQARPSPARLGGAVGIAPAAPGGGELAAADQTEFVAD